MKGPACCFALICPRLTQGVAFGFCGSSFKGLALQKVDIGKSVSFRVSQIRGGSRDRHCRWPGFFVQHQILYPFRALRNFSRSSLKLAGRAAQQSRHSRHLCDMFQQLSSQFIRHRIPFSYGFHPAIMYVSLATAICLHDLHASQKRCSTSSV